MKQNIFLLWVIIFLLLVAIVQLARISSKLEDIDWDTRQILGKVNN